MFGIDDIALLAASLIPSIGGAIIGNAGAKSRMDSMNAYNTPAAQMQRFKDAGLNPNLVYTQGTAGNQGSPAEFITPEVDPIRIYSAAQAARESKMRTELHAARKNAQYFLSQYLSNKYEAEAPFMGRNARYQSSMLEARYKGELQQQSSESLRQRIMEVDRQIRGQISQGKSYELKGLENMNPRLRDSMNIFLRLLQGASSFK